MHFLEGRAAKVLGVSAPPCSPLMMVVCVYKVNMSRHSHKLLIKTLM